MDIESIQERIRGEQFRLSIHAEIEAEEENLDIAQIIEAILNDEILEHYPDTGRGESCLLVGFSNDIPIHVVCGMRKNLVIIITLYIPQPPKFLDPWTRSRS